VPTLRVTPYRAHSAEFFFDSNNLLNVARTHSLGLTAKRGAKMKYAISAIAASLFLTTAVATAQELTIPPIKADSATEDCSKQVWPNFSPACLRNADRTINVRLVTATRR
jgi:hypothetical protein